MSLARSILLRASRSRWLAEQFRRRRFAQRAVRRFMPGETIEAALAAAADFSASGLGTVFTHLGERIDSRSEAAAVRDHYLSVLDTIRQRGLPAHISVKLTQLGLGIDGQTCIQNITDLASRAEQCRSFLWIDMEESQYVDETLAVFRAARQTHTQVGVCLQSYLRRTPADVDSLLPFSPAIRLVKGAYREPKEIAYPRKSDTDRAFLAIAERLLDAAREGRSFPVFGTHDMALLERIEERGQALNVPRRRYELHMLYGIRSAEQRSLAARGVVLRVLISYGENWFPWYVRRLAERPANVWFVLKNLWS